MHMLYYSYFSGFVLTAILNSICILCECIIYSDECVIQHLHECLSYTYNILCFSCVVVSKTYLC